ncbi:MAG TPA: DUF1553 domain-containing protein [Pirellulaceae bacterium]|nr:DUF1553 domain-containing protein [Pirellulaceae bacterium]
MARIQVKSQYYQGLPTYTQRVGISVSLELQPPICMWARNCLFIAVCFAGAGLVANTLLRRQRAPQPRSANATDVSVRTMARDAGEFQVELEKLNAEFREHAQDKGLATAPAADHLTIARRLALALVGTIPSLEEIRALEAVPPEARVAWWTSHLLEDRRFADYWAERLARIYVGNEQGNIVLFRRRRFRLWLGDQLAKNTPYDQIVRELLAEEGIWTGKPATNFITATVNPGGDNKPDPVRLAGRTARAFLGMRIDCLQCHDDKLGNVNVGSEDDIHSGTQATFHELAAFFGPTEVKLVGVTEGDKPYKYKYLNTDNETVVRPHVPFGADLFDGHGSRRGQLARWVTHPKNKPFARATVNRVWALLVGKPLVEPIDDIPLAGHYPPGLELLADDFVAHGYDLHRLIRLIAVCDALQRDSRADFEITDEHEKAWAVFPLSRLRPEQISGSLIQAASLKTIDGQAHVVTRIAMFGQTNQFVERYGDLGEDEFTARGSTIPQRLLMMNGNLVKERTQPNPLVSASTRIATLTGKPETQVEAAYLAILTRRPTAEESQHFVARLKDRENRNRQQALEDLYWTLANSTEFSWNH